MWLKDMHDNVPPEKKFPWPSWTSHTIEALENTTSIWNLHGFNERLDRLVHLNKIWVWSILNIKSDWTSAYRYQVIKVMSRNTSPHETNLCRRLGGSTTTSNTLTLQYLNKANEQWKTIYLDTARENEQLMIKWIEKLVLAD